MQQVDLRHANRHDVPELMPLFEDLYRGDTGRHFTDILREYIDFENRLVALATSVVLFIGTRAYGRDLYARKNP